MCGYQYQVGGSLGNNADYLRTNVEVKKEDRRLCGDIVKKIDS